MREGIRDFIVRCSEAGRSQKTTHFLYVNGKDQCGNSIPLKMHLHLQRGASLDNLVRMWLFTWGQEEEM